MSRVILCGGKKAAKPYFFKLSGVYVYTIEELCYCLRKSLDMLDESVIDRDMALFMAKELGLKERGELLEQLVLTKADLKSRLVVVLCSSDLFDEGEIKAICDELAELNAMPMVGRRKRRADRFMAEGNLSGAYSEYRNIMADPDVRQLDDKEYGDILHNMAVGELKDNDPERVSTMFREAYDHNHDPESLRCYLLTLKLAHREDEYIAEARRYGDSGRLVDHLEQELSMLEDNMEQSGELENVNRMRVLMQQGRYSEADRLAAETIASFKRSYRMAVRENESAGEITV